MSQSSPITIKEAERAIGEPATAWGGRCFEIASRLVKASTVKGTAVFGHWTGPVHPRSRFASRGAGFVQHGWIVTDDDSGAVIDPTRWAFEAKDPYIYSGEPPDLFGNSPCDTCELLEGEHGDEGVPDNCSNYYVMPWPYDEGGNRLRERHLQPAPQPRAGDKRIGITFTDDAIQFVRRVLELPARGRTDRLTMEQIRWLGNLPYARLKEHAHAIYQSIVTVGHVAVIPLDNRRRAERLHGTFQEKP